MAALTLQQRPSSSTWRLNWCNSVTIIGGPIVTQLTSRLANCGNLCASWLGCPDLLGTGLIREDSRVWNDILAVAPYGTGGTILFRLVNMRDASCAAAVSYHQDESIHSGSKLEFKAALQILCLFNSMILLALCVRRCDDEAQEWF
jgi:hypothetical protein